MSIPKWRYVRHTDDGSDLYQCLSCYKSWDTRNAPGYYSTTRSVDKPTPGSHSYRSTDRDGTVVIHHYEMTDPTYVECQSFCPYCGVKWDEEGAVRCSEDNEYMYGPRRAAIHKLVTERRYAEGWREPEYTRLWWVIVERQTWRGEEPKENWAPKEYARVDLMPAAKMLYLLRDYQARLDADHNNDPHGFCNYEAKIVVTFVKPMHGYEIRNYDWERPEPDYARSKSRHNS